VDHFNLNVQSDPDFAVVLTRHRGRYETRHLERYTARRARDHHLGFPYSSRGFFMSSLLDSLNAAQREAAAHYEGPALVVAGAGSGKTRTVVHRVGHLMEAHGVYPTEILAVTFTNKAAAEMKTRVVDLVGPQASQIWVSTFHSSGVRILRAYGEAVGLRPGFVIYDDGDQLDVIKTVFAGIPSAGEINPRYLRSVIDKCKSNLWSPEDLAREGEEWMSGMPKDVAVEGFRRYQNAMRRANAIDFGDLLSMVVELFRKEPEILDKIQQRAVFIHVDEYQDTNKAQYEFARLLAGKYRNLLVVGDPDQGIYSFRGADIQNILDFQNDYQDAVVFRLEENYRSNARILEVANVLIAHNTERLEKVLRPVKPDGEPVRFYRAPDHRSEAEFVANRIEHLQATGANLDKIAILYRTNAQSRVLEERFLRSNVAYKLVGGTSFYDRQEIKDMLSLARLAINPDDDIAIKRALKRPKRGVGDASISKLEDWARANRVSLFSAFGKADEILERGGKNAQEFHTLILELGEYASEHTPSEFLKLAMDASGYLEMLKTDKSETRAESEARLENLEELLVGAEEWQKENDGNIEAYLDDAALLSSVDDARTKRENKGEPVPAVTFMTMHNAKGLEFEEVFIVGLEEGLLPHRSSIVEPGGIEEERRLFYVGITRAMDRLTMTMAESRQTFGKTAPSEDSRFLQDIPKDLFTPVNLFYQPYTDAKIDAHRVAPHIEAQIARAGGAVLSVKGGENVMHPKFGVGKVLAVTGSGDKLEAMIAFDHGVGTKKLLLKYANLVFATG
jgi:DNA helicase II / ATP-dependent DNA helicase PcrA